MLPNGQKLVMLGLLGLWVFLHHHGGKLLYSHVGDVPEDCQLFLFTDASFAGEIENSKSTSGCVLVLCGPQTWAPITWLCKKQTAVSHSSTEAEVISMDAGLRLEGIPALSLRDTVIAIFHRYKDKSPDREAHEMLEGVLDQLVRP